jgi:hypothetical protein
MKKAFQIKEVKNRIFLFQFNNHYDMCMHFLRYQEYYESASPKYRGKNFEILDFMKWYSLKYGKGSFTYPNDWNGFNIPGDVISKVWEAGISDRNIYDYEMKMAWQQCKEKAGDQPFYIIGVVRGNSALGHEIAHGMFYLHPGYKKESSKLVKKLDPHIRKSLNKTLKKLGYTPKVYVDETQAYMSTGLTEAFGEVDQWKEERKEFQKLFKKFSREVK